jgi:hypothetical protein
MGGRLGVTARWPHGRALDEARISRETCYKQSMTLADLNGLSPADANATPWVATRDGSWTRLVGADVNLDIPPSKEGAVTRPRIDRPPLRSEASGRDA